MFMIAEKTFNSRLGFRKEPIALDGEPTVFNSKDDAFQAIVRAYEANKYQKGQLGILAL